MKKTAINSELAPSAVGPYSHANLAGDMVFVSGQLGLNPATGKLAEGVEAQAEQGLTNLKNVLEACGSSLDQVVKTTVFLSDIADFAAVNAIYAQYFTTDYPARSCVQVAALPMGAAFEIEAVAVRN